MTELQTKYNANIEAIREQIKMLTQKIDQHEAKQAQEPKNWGSVGDLGHVRAELAETLRFLG